MPSKWIRRVLYFDRKERWGLVFLIGLLVGLYGIGSLYPARPLQMSRPPDSTWGEAPKNGSVSDREVAFKEVKVGPFDPNRIAEEEWVTMGISPKTARTIQNYLAKGGRFRRPADLRKIWGLNPSDCDRLMPFVRIEGSRTKADERLEYSKKIPHGGSLPGENFSNRKRKLIDLNLSDSVEWESLPGIGPGYARRITRYRERLGGFVRAEQVGETYQLPDSVFRKLRRYLGDASEKMVRQLNVNTAVIDSLGRHPYCGYSKARLIVRYREQHGSFGRLEDLLDIQTLDVAWLERIRPYLKLQ